MRITGLKTNHLVNPIGYDFGEPSVSWITEDTNAKKQTGAQITVFVSRERKFNAAPDTLIFDSGRTAGISSLGYVLPFCLEPYTRYWWKVRVWADNGETAESGWAFFETGKMKSPWEAKWICAGFDKDIHPYIKKEFAFEEGIQWARAYVCGLGLYELEINGRKVGDEYLTPGYHAYDHFIQYQTWDITGLLASGRNCAGVMLGPGWYKGRFVFEDGHRNIYGDTMELICEIHAGLADGSEVVIGSDDTWLCHASPVSTSGIYDGEWYDGAKEIQGWSLPGCPQEGWRNVRETRRSTSTLTERINPPITVHERIQPRKIITTDTGESVLDFEQEISGWVEFNTKNAEAGMNIRLTYGEIMQDGRFYRDNLRTAKAEHIFIPAHENPGTVRPHFTFFGFRYVKVEGMKKIEADNFTATAVYSDIERAGWIETSDENINRLFENTVWSQKDNFLDIPTDCPQRDERMGWTGDVAIFCETANQHFDTPSFFNHYLKNVRKEQEYNDGAVPLFAPMPKLDRNRVRNGFLSQYCGYSVWGDVATILPWSLYLMYGDKHLLNSHYPLMKTWADYIIKEDKKDGDKGLWQTGRHLGDWLALDTDNPQSMKGATDVYYIASAFYYNTVYLTAKAARVLGKTTDFMFYEAQAKKIKVSFLKTYFDDGNNLTIAETQTALVIALYFELFPEGTAQKLLDRLVKHLQSKDNHLDTGFVGTPFLCQVLSKYGANDTAYSLLLQKTYPGWLYEVSMGATTIWERWNSVLPDGKISGTEMNSLNHYSYGSIANWMYRYMCGLNPLDDKPGYKKVHIAPKPDRRIKKAHMVRRTAAGVYETAWEYREDGCLCFRIVVPFDCEALISLPGREDRRVGPGEHSWSYIY